MTRLIVNKSERFLYFPQSFSLGHTHTGTHLDTHMLSYRFLVGSEQCAAEAAVVEAVRQEKGRGF